MERDGGICLHGLCVSASLEQHQEAEGGITQVQAELHHCHAAVAASVRIFVAGVGVAMDVRFREGQRPVGLIGQVLEREHLRKAWTC